jgi:hypothetical protein
MKKQVEVIIYIIGEILIVLGGIDVIGLVELNSDQMSIMTAFLTMSFLLGKAIVKRFKKEING